MALNLWDSVLNAYQSFTGTLEGNMLPYMYTDVKGLITTGTGNLIDTIPHSPTVTAMALALPWRHGVGGPLASPNEVQAGWTAVGDAWPDVQSVASQNLTDLRLDQDALNQLVAGKLKANDTILAQTYPGYPQWPADAQLAINSMMWAMGLPGPGNFPHLYAALTQNPPDFAAAAGPPGDANTDAGARGQAWINDAGNPGLRPRNLDNKKLFTNAAAVVASGNKSLYSTLFYPGDFTGVAAKAGIGLGTLLVASAGGWAAFRTYKKQPIWPFGKRA